MYCQNIAGINFSGISKIKYVKHKPVNKKEEFDALCWTTLVKADCNLNLPQEYNNSFIYCIDKLYSFSKGSGTKAVQNVVRKSLENPNTNGRVGLYAQKMIEHPSPIGFYYKLGFRSVVPEYNKICEEWLASGGNKANAPLYSGVYMYLPKENIEKCLNYPAK